MEHRGTLFWPQIEEEFTRRNARWWESHEEVPTVDFTVGSESMNQQVEMEVGLVPTLVGPLIVNCDKKTKVSDYFLEWNSI